jgi:hypothetical protein
MRVRHLSSKETKMVIKKIPRGKPGWGRRSTKVLVVIDDDLLEKLQYIAEDVEVSRNSVIVHALQKFIKELK